jgi:hypothetical protein
MGTLARVISKPDPSQAAAPSSKKEIACLPDERHSTSPRKSLPIMDTDRVCAVYLDAHEVIGVDVHDVISDYVTASTSSGRG